jgi:ubiquinone/menaquinone biosynthesis C-methylase UbiE
VSSGVRVADKVLVEIFKINPLRAFIASKYLLEMKEAMTEAIRVLKPDGYFVLVTSANEICGVNFNTHKFLSIIAGSLGLTVELRLVDIIHSRGLMTKRNKTAGIISCEWVYIFRKE